MQALKAGIPNAAAIQSLVVQPVQQTGSAT